MGDTHADRFPLLAYAFHCLGSAHVPAPTLRTFPLSSDVILTGEFRAPRRGFAEESFHFFWKFSLPHGRTV